MADTLTPLDKAALLEVTPDRVTGPKNLESLRTEPQQTPKDLVRTVLSALEGTPEVTVTLDPTQRPMVVFRGTWNGRLVRTAVRNLLRSYRTYQLERRRAFDLANKRSADALLTTNPEGVENG